MTMFPEFKREPMSWFACCFLYPLFFVLMVLIDFLEGTKKCFTRSIAKRANTRP